jgi:hypothetical protein
MHRNLLELHRTVEASDDKDVKGSTAFVSLLSVPRYIIERKFDVTEEAMPQVGKKSHRITVEELPEITWEHSHVVIGDGGLVTTFCIYTAPSETAVRQHSEALGAHRIVAIHEVAGDVTPADFPLD